MRVLTDWFPATTVPMRVGEYLTRLCHTDHLALMLTWDGTKWRSSTGYPYSHVFQWRGLAFDPNAAAEYARANPLGGPAAVFDAAAERIRAGEPLDSVMRDYGIAWVTKP